ncbi:Zinc-binding dehydrogenase [Rhizoctonia solani]|uniref:Zinc-binding dehydrogenase n=1 Tax=Rhizoctonia solani TaxID=456999 RepID=A0A8H7M4B4_9AGAM|nr:Zinc-binding dehydrogenase [Rhizoctonia solani]
MAVPETQQGWRVVRQGLPSKALAFQTFPVPKIRDGEVLKKTALNPVGYKLMQLLPNLFSHRPHVAEHDFTGIIVDAGSSNYKVGDAVLGFIPVPTQQKNGQGALAQYVSVSTGYIVPRPPSLVATQAAGLSLAGVTAYLAIAQFLDVESGQHILINGGSSSVGSLAIRSPRRGCNVTASCSTANIDLVKDLGADEFHGIFDCVGNTPLLFLRSPAYLAPSGKFISTGPSMDKLSQFRVLYGTWFKLLCGLVGWAVYPGTMSETIVGLTSIDKCLSEITKLVNDGQLRPLVDSVHSFDEVLNAYDRIITRRAKGKVVVTIN